MSASTPVHVLLVEDDAATEVLVREEGPGAAIEVLSADRWRPASPSPSHLA